MRESVHPRNFTIGAWRRRLDSAVSAPEVLRIAREFLETWEPDEIERLPEGCRPGRLREPGDVRCYAMQLARAEFADDAGAMEMLRMSGFFSAAAERLAQSGDPSDKHNPSARVVPGRTNAVQRLERQAE